MRKRTTENPLLSTTAFKKYLVERGYSLKTIESMAERAERFISWMEKENISIENLRYADVMAWLQSFKKKDMKQKSKNTYISTLKRYLDHLVEEDILPANPADQIKLQGTNHRTVYQILTREELEELYNKYPIKHRISLYQLAATQNKVIAGLLIWQGLRSEDVERLKATDVKLKEGTIYVPGSRKMEARTLKLQSSQILELSDYMYQTRKALQQRANTKTEQLFISTAGSPNIRSLMRGVAYRLRKIQPKLRDLNHIRASVITHWLKEYNLRKVQYMAGHRYVSSTEKYKLNDLEGLREEVSKFHPIN